MVSSWSWLGLPHSVHCCIPTHKPSCWHIRGIKHVAWIPHSHHACNVHWDSASCQDSSSCTLGGKGPVWSWRLEYNQEAGNHFLKLILIFSPPPKLGKANSLAGFNYKLVHIFLSLFKVNQHCGNEGLSLEKVKPILTKYVMEELHLVISLVTYKSRKGQHSACSLGLIHAVERGLGQTQPSPISSNQALDPIKARRAGIPSSKWG